jgi:hypothetical protein
MANPENEGNRMRGGPRKGAGRPEKAIKLQRKTFALEPQHWQWLETLANVREIPQAQMLRDLIDEAFRRSR